MSQYQTVMNAKTLQRKGLTLSKIAEVLDKRREYIVRVLYWNLVRDA